MKRLTKTLAAFAVAAVASLSVAAFAGCGSSTTYEGEYKYENAWSAGSYYGIKVSVTLDSDDVIESVTIVDSDYTEVTESWTNKATWDDNVNALLAAYEGKSAVDVMAQYVDVQDSGEPTAQDGDGFNVYDSDLIITGATVGSGRLLLAVQNALEDAGYKSYVGEYKYENAWAAGSYYGIKVNVVVKDNDIIEKIAIVDSDYTEVTDSWSDKTVWENGIDALLEAYVGTPVSEIMLLNVVCNDSGEPLASAADGFVSYDSDLIISGATVGSGRLLLAIQNAVGNL